MKANIIKVTVGLMACLISICMPYDAAFALTRADYNKQGIKYYDEAAEALLCSTSVNGTANLVGNSVAEKIWNFLIGKGLDANQTAGVMGNIKAESNYEPGVEENTPRASKGYGIAQWTFDRRTALEAAAKSAGVPSSDLGLQLNFLFEEVNARKPHFPEYKQYPNEWAMLKAQTTIEDALVAFHHEFERSHILTDYEDPRAEVIKQRLQGAKDAYASFSKNTAPEGSTNSEGCVSGGGGDLLQTVVKYAWPEHHDAPYFDMKPDYDAAIKKAQAEGRYVGGLDHPGIDCGGFVTTLMFDSGFEPNYNYKAKGGNTTSQEAWVAANWQNLGNNVNSATLQPGDVAFSPGHTFVWIGTVSGFETKVASASVSFNGTGWRTPMSGLENPTSSDVTWYRKKA